MPPVPKPELPVSGPLHHHFDEYSFCDEESLLLLKQQHSTTTASTFYSDLLRDESDLTLSTGCGSRSSQDNDDDDDDDQQLQRKKSDNHANASCLSRLWSQYCNALQQRPLLVKSVTAFFLMGWADGLAQLVESIVAAQQNDNSTTTTITTATANSFDMDWLRSLRFAIFGLVGAPWTHYYYDWLDTVLPPTPEPWTWTTAIKVVIDQFIQAPILLAFIIMGMALMQGDGIAGMMGDMRGEYVSTLIENWKLWIPATIINIAFVRPELRVLYDNLVFFAWTIILSMILNSP